MTIESLDKDCGDLAPDIPDTELLISQEDVLNEDWSDTDCCIRMIELFFRFYYVPFCNCIIPYICIPCMCNVCCCPKSSYRSFRCLTLLQ
jgi:hypothetical protein